MERKRRVWGERRGIKHRRRWRGACRIIVKTVEEEMDGIEASRSYEGRVSVVRDVLSAETSPPRKTDDVQTRGRLGNCLVH